MARVLLFGPLRDLAGWRSATPRSKSSAASFVFSAPSEGQSMSRSRQPARDSACARSLPKQKRHTP